MNRFSFPKSERLCSKKILEELFSQSNDRNSSSVFLFPFKVLVFWDASLVPVLSSHTSVPAPQIVFIVPKKNFKRANQRNKIRRRLKEIYRLNKDYIFQSFSNLPSVIGVVFVSKEHKDYLFLQKKLIQALLSLSSLDKQKK